MKKIISLIILIALIFMLEFNLLEPILQNAFRWIEPLIAFLVIIALTVWNDLHKNIQ